jgi:hypothetical protein
MTTKEAPSFTEDLPKPILASVFRAFGWLSLIACLITSVILIRTVDNWFAAMGFIYALCAAAFSSVIFFGIAQMIHKIALIEFHASKQKSDAILQSLHKIESHLEALRNNKNIT